MGDFVRTLPGLMEAIYGSDLSSFMTRCICQVQVSRRNMVRCRLCDMYSHGDCVGLNTSKDSHAYVCFYCANSTPDERTLGTSHRVKYPYQDPDIVEAINISSASTRYAWGPQQLYCLSDHEPAILSGEATTDSGIGTDEIGSTVEPFCPSATDSGIVIDDIGGDIEDTDPCLLRLSDTESRTSSGRSMDDLDDLENNFLDVEISNFRSWLLVQSKSAPSLRHLRSQVAHRQHTSSTPRDQSTASSSASSSDPSSSSSSSPSSSSTVPTTLSNGIASGSKRQRDDRSEDNERPKKRLHVPSDRGGVTSAPRFACFYNRYDPMMYRSSAQTDKRFEVCETHDFENMNRLYEHLKRVHSHQPLQCPRCTRTGFKNSGELQTHQTASTPCKLVSLSAVKRIKWISQDERIALQTAVNRQSADLRRLGSCTEEDRWKIAYRWLFPDTQHVPSPYLQDPVISAVSFGIDDYEARLRDQIRQSSDLDDLARRIPTIRRQFLAQYFMHDAGTIPGGSRSQRPTSLSNVVQPRQSNFGSQDDAAQVVLSTVHRSSGIISPEEQSSASLVPQTTPSWPQSHGIAPTPQTTGAYHTLPITINPQATTSPYPLMPTTQWPISAQDRSVSNSMRDRQSQSLQTQAITVPRYHGEWHEGGDDDWYSNQDPPSSFGTGNIDDFLTNDLFQAGSWAA